MPVEAGYSTIDRWRLTELLGMHRNQPAIEQNFAHVLAVSLHTDFVQKSFMFYMLLSWPADALDGGTPLAIG